MTANRIYLAQHGLALDKSIDAERPLSADGILQSHAIARQLGHSDLTVSRLFHSGKLRAAQTAEIFATQLFNLEVSPIDGFSPDDEVTIAARQLDVDDALYIGHLPHLDRLISYLVCHDPHAGILRLQNSAVVCLTRKSEHYQIHSYITPNIVNTS